LEGDHYKAELLSIQDYYPFGMLQPDRRYSLGTYRYGFNGQEKSDEIKGEGNSYTAMFWKYDPRIGRRWNLDPEPITDISQYATFNNSPILYSDVLGNSSEPPAWYTKAKATYMLFMHGIGGDASKAGEDFDRGIDKVTNIGMKSGTQIKGELTEGGKNLYWSFWGDVNGLVKAGSLGIYSRKAEDFNVSGSQAGYFDGGTKVFENAGMIEGVSGGGAPRLSLVAETQAVKTTASLELRTAAIVYSTANSGQNNGQSQNSSGSSKSAKTSGWVKPSVFNSLDGSIQKKVAAAIQKGIVGAENQQGIIKLTATEATKTGYQYKVKILGKGGDIRIYGNRMANGHIYFDKIGGH
jgi:hypothetical protein